VHFVGGFVGGRQIEAQRRREWIFGAPFVLGGGSLLPSPQGAHPFIHFGGPAATQLSAFWGNGEVEPGLWEERSTKKRRKYFWGGIKKWKFSEKVVIFREFAKMWKNPRKISENRKFSGEHNFRKKLKNIYWNVLVSGEFLKKFTIVSKFCEMATFWEKFWERRTISEEIFGNVDILEKIPCSIFRIFVRI
jgi:hypothetical protein